MCIRKSQSGSHMNLFPQAKHFTGRQTVSRDGGFMERAMCPCNPILAASMALIGYIVDINNSNDSNFWKLEMQLQNLFSFVFERQMIHFMSKRAKSRTTLFDDPGTHF